MKSVLRSIRIKDFALIRQLEIEFFEGLTVFSGETGAGKSVVIDAVNMIMGSRASGDYIRSGCERFVIDASFEVASNDAALYQRLADFGLEPEDGLMIISREYSAASRNNCRVNGRPVTLGQLRMMTQSLIEIHGQNENQSLLSPSVQLELLDELAGTCVRELKHDIAAIVGQMKDLGARRDELGGDEAERTRKIDFVIFELDEITGAAITQEEETSLREEKEKLANYGKIVEALSEAYSLLAGSDELPSPHALLSKCFALVGHAAEHDLALAKHADNLLSACEMVGETTSYLSDYLEAANFNPERLEAIDDRLYRYSELKRKYGETVSLVLAYAEKLERFLDEQKSAAEILQGLDAKGKKLTEEFYQQAARLHAARAEAACDIEQRIIGELDDLAMRGASFNVQFHESSDISKNGTDIVEYLIATNPGEAMKNMARIASGGEISRIMLALRVILAAVGHIDTMVFDEVDAGIGGRTAQAVAEKLYFISHGRQVFCVTHSPQIAAFADHHVGISKIGEEDGAVITAHQLSGDERNQEIARMIAGAEITEMSMLHAREMLQLAAGKK